MNLKHELLWNVEAEWLHLFRVASRSGRMPAGGKYGYAELGTDLIFMSCFHSCSLGRKV